MDMISIRRFLPALLVLPFGAGAQSTPVLQLGKPDATPDAEFTKVVSAHELAPGRLLVGDERERKLTVLDFGAGTARTVGRVGAGPGEFRSVGTILPRKTGGVFVTDYVLRRLLPVTPEGSVVDPVPYPAASLLFAAADTSGRLYANTMIFRDRVLSDSMRVVRWDPSTGVVDTLLTFDAGRSGMIIHPGEKRRVWYSTTSWAPLADGSIALVDAANYRMSRWASGVSREVAALPFTPQLVTAADRQAVIDAEKNEKPVALGQGGAGPAAAHARPEPAFPATFPAFGPDTPLWRSPDGALWVERLTSPRDSVPLMDVLSPAGKVLAQVRLPARSRILAFGKDRIYLVERDRDDVEYVRRYAYPATPRP